MSDRTSFDTVADGRQRPTVTFKRRDRRIAIGPTHFITSARTKLTLQTRQTAMRRLQVWRLPWCAPSG
jgi:hypothetical protein